MKKTFLAFKTDYKKATHLHSHKKKRKALVRVPERFIKNIGVTDYFNLLSLQSYSLISKKNSQPSKVEEEVKRSGTYF
ncbi:MAG: hypothetical protein HKK67_00230 [Chlorobiaceae bacterium]|nr:hypothetical protein [Chlorobiaceae bacterium]